MEKDIIEKLTAKVEKLRGEDLYQALRGQNTRLLAVAVAAKVVVDTPEKQFFSLDELEAALAAVEDLL